MTEEEVDFYASIETENGSGGRLCQRSDYTTPEKIFSLEDRCIFIRSTMSMMARGSRSEALRCLRTSRDGERKRALPLMLWSALSQLGIESPTLMCSCAISTGRGEGAAKARAHVNW